MSESLELLATLMTVAAPIIAIVFIVQFFKYRTEVKKRDLTKSDALDKRVMEEMRATIERLNERMQTVERIITDGKYHLVNDIDDLK